MKIFVSWSGELSRQIAQELKTWLPCFFDAVDVFYSPKDIAKGDEWDAKIIQELSESSYGIVCLTSENITAPWINFEAGAITNALDSKVAPLMIGIKPSDIKGPLKRYQGTRLDKEDMRQLIFDINNATEKPGDEAVLAKRFDAMWDKAYEAIKKCVDDYSPVKIDGLEQEQETKGEAIEEILQLVRKQNTLLSSPEQLLPPAYIDSVVRRSSLSQNHTEIAEDIMIGIEQLIDLLYNVNGQGLLEENSKLVLQELDILDFIEFLIDRLKMYDLIDIKNNSYVTKLKHRLEKLEGILY